MVTKPALAFAGVDAPGPLLRLARTVSLLFQPILTGVYLLFAVALMASDTVAGGLGWAAGLSALSAGMPALDLAVRLRTGRIGDFQMILREERLRPLAVALGWTFLALALAWGMAAPWALVVALLTGGANGVILTAITAWWKISFHTATLTGGILVLSWFGGLPWLALAPLVVLVGWSRVKLRRHTPAQTVAGAALAAVVTWTVLAAAA